MKNLQKNFLIFCVVLALVIGAAVATLNPGESPLIGFLSAFLLSGLSLLALGWLWRKLGGSRVLAWTVFLAFLLRLGIGMLLFVALPVFGYDEDPTNAGYLYLDAYRRDSDAWRLAESGEPLGVAFQEEFATDQYGGLLSLSAGMYRVFSPDGHRPLLILILTSFAAAAGLPFLWQVVRKRWGERTANVVAWLYALYPESVILGASQMREPMLIGLSAVAAWGVGKWKDNRTRSLLALGISFVLMLFLSVKAAGAILAVMAIWFWLENIQPKAGKGLRLGGILLLVAGLLAGLYFSWSWLVDSSKWDLYLMQSSSGRIQWEVTLISDLLRVPFIVGYGLAQPVLPAAIVYPGIAINRAISIFRALGWYMLAPLLITGFILVWKEKDKQKKLLLLFFMLVSVVWTMISSARAGGDQWDNPRYRSILLIWMLIPAAWTYVTTLERRSPWLWRLLALELFYVGFFIQWYLSRYYGLFKRMNFWPMVRLLGGAGFAIIFGGLAYDWAKKKIGEKRG